MLRAYRRCEEKRTARLEILRGLIEMMSAETVKQTGIATLHQPPKTPNDAIGNMPMPKEDFATERATA